MTLERRALRPAAPAQQPGQAPFARHRLDRIAKLENFPADQHPVLAIGQASAGRGVQHHAGIFELDRQLCHLLQHQR